MEQMDRYIFIGIFGCISFCTVLALLLFLMCHRRRTLRVHDDIFDWCYSSSLAARLCGNRPENLRDKLCSDCNRVLLMCPKPKKNTKTELKTTASEREEMVMPEMRGIAPADKMQTIYMELPILVCSELGGADRPPLPPPPPSLPERPPATPPPESVTVTMENQQSVTTAVATELAVSFPSVTPEMVAVIEAAVHSTLRIITSMQTGGMSQE
ncbi:Ba168 [Baboon cytomegalovirus]|nr:Ba168 [Baboon cytomegalovirus]